MILLHNQHLSCSCTSSSSNSHPLLISNQTYLRVLHFTISSLPLARNTTPSKYRFIFLAIHCVQTTGTSWIIYFHCLDSVSFLTFSHFFRVQVTLAYICQCYKYYAVYPFIMLILLILPFSFPTKFFLVSISPHRRGWSQDI